jgi:hypothetical protein
MMPGQKIHFEIKPVWGVISEIADQIATLMENEKPDLGDATRMVASELIENAVKFGTFTGKNNLIIFDLGIENDIITIKVVNKAEVKKNIENVRRIIGEINGPASPKELYTRRLRELMEKPKPGESMLGLYRIAYEGEYKLSHELSGDLLVVSAKRKLNR